MAMRNNEKAMVTATKKPRTKPKTAVKPKAKPQAQKPATPPKTENPNDTELLIPDNVVVDLNAYDWGEEELTDAQKLFVIWYTTPGTPYYHKAMPAAIKAGYSQNTALVKAHKMKQDPRIAKLIKQFEDAIGKVNIVETAQRWLQEKIIRGDYNIRDFYETAIEVRKNGDVRTVLQLKPIEDLTPEQILCIDSVDVKGQQGTTIYVLPDREKIRDSLIALVRKQEMEADNVDGEEETMEIIMERLVMKKTIRSKKDELSHIAKLVRLPKGDMVTEL